VAPEFWGLVLPEKAGKSSASPRAHDQGASHAAERLLRNYLKSISQKKAQDGGGSTFRANRQMHLCLSRALAIKRERTARLFQAADSIRDMLLVHIPKFRNGAGKILANALTPDFSGASDIILGYAFNSAFERSPVLCYPIMGRRILLNCANKR
jgi:hypothetical protein